MVGRALVAGWFSFPEMGATAGDLYARDLCVEWLTTAGWTADIAVAPPFSGGVRWQDVASTEVSLVVFVCGPFGNGWPIPEFLEHFTGVRLVGLNLTMLEGLAAWDPFDVLLERDSDRTSRPDISFLASALPVPLIGHVAVHPQDEYPDGMHAEVDDLVRRSLAARDVARVPIDTRLDTNQTGLDTPRQVESMIRRMDAVVTTRLHGMVLSLKNGVPPVVIDPIAGGRKVIRQARTLGWETAFIADQIDEPMLNDALDYCLSPQARADADEVRTRAVEATKRTRNDFISLMRKD